MFKLFKRKPVQEVVRVEDLQVGDVVQYDLVTLACVDSIVFAREQQFDNEPEYKIMFKDVTPGGPHGYFWESTLFGNSKIFVWK